MTIVFVSDIGVANIVFRNSSNGYYGGCAFLVKEINAYAKNRMMLSVKTDYSADYPGAE